MTARPRPRGLVAVAALLAAGSVALAQDIDEIPYTGRDWYEPDAWLVPDEGAAYDYDFDPDPQGRYGVFDRTFYGVFGYGAQETYYEELADPEDSPYDREERPAAGPPERLPAEPAEQKDVRPKLEPTERLGDAYGGHWEYDAAAKAWVYDYGWRAAPEPTPIEGQEPATDDVEPTATQPRATREQEGRSLPASAKRQRTDGAERAAPTKAPLGQRGDTASASGTVKGVYRAELGGVKTVLVRLEQPDGSLVTVDLGGEDAFERYSVEAGDALTVDGLVGRVRGRRVLLARSVETGGEHRAVPPRSLARSTRVLEGELRSAYRLRGTGRDTTLVRLILEDGEVATVDFGDSRRFQSLGLTPGDTIRVEGSVLPIDDRKVLRASSLEVEGDTFRLDRPATLAPREAGHGREASASRVLVRGEIARVRALRVGGELLVTLALKGSSELRLVFAEGRDPVSLGLVEGATLRAEGTATWVNGDPAIRVLELVVDGETKLTRDH
ncbi:MAG: hypothetical protein R3F62_21015 [Planctomycetota bacterium]